VSTTINNRKAPFIFAPFFFFAASALRSARHSTPKKARHLTLNQLVLV